MTPMEHALGIVENEMNTCYETISKSESIERHTDASFLAQVTRFIHNKIEYFKGRKITFLIDDFSLHRIPEPVQQLLNSIIWDRQATHIFKLSSEKHGAVILDVLNGTAEATRELREIDCGQFYIDLSDKGLVTASRQFARELLANRLLLAGYDTEATPEKILGNSKYEEGSLGKALRARGEKRGRIDDQYYGIETIADLCSGDISVLLEVFRRIFQIGKINHQSKEMVPRHLQHSAIRAVSTDSMSVIKNYVPRGEDMFNIVYWFGNLSRRILREGYLQKKGKKVIPCETSRIEVDQAPGKLSEKWTEEQRELILELARRSCFIDMRAGFGRHGLKPTIRLQLRRVFCPSSGTSLAKNTAVKWSIGELKYFLTNPQEACDSEFEKRWKKEPPAIKDYSTPLLNGWDSAMENINWEQEENRE